MQLSCNNTNMSTDLQQLLQRQGQRLTKQRRAILACLSHSPQNVSTIRQLLATNGVNLDKTTVYRNLHSLVKLGLVLATKLQDDGLYYELADHHHHHHVQCQNCGKIEDIELDEQALLQAATSHSSFRIKNHQLEFFGLCPNCQ